MGHLSRDTRQAQMPDYLCLIYRTWRSSSNSSINLHPEYAGFQV